MGLVDIMLALLLPVEVNAIGAGGGNLAGTRCSVSFAFLGSPVEVFRCVDGTTDRFVPLLALAQ